MPATLPAIEPSRPRRTFPGWVAPTLALVLGGLAAREASAQPSQAAPGRPGRVVLIRPAPAPALVPVRWVAVPARAPAPVRVRPAPAAPRVGFSYQAGYAANGVPAFGGVPAYGMGAPYGGAAGPGSMGLWSGPAAGYGSGYPGYGFGSPGDGYRGGFPIGPPGFPAGLPGSGRSPAWAGPFGR